MCSPDGGQRRDGTDTAPKSAAHQEVSFMTVTVTGPDVMTTPARPPGTAARPLFG